MPFQMSLHTCVVMGGCLVLAQGMLTWLPLLGPAFASWNYHLSSMYTSPLSPVHTGTALYPGVFIVLPLYLA